MSQSAAIAATPSHLVCSSQLEFRHNQFLGVTRQEPAGVERAHQLLHALTGGGPGPFPSEPVLVLRNDYGRELWNGEPGIAVRARRPGRATTTVCAFRSRRGWLAVDPAASFS